MAKVQNSIADQLGTILIMGSLIMGSATILFEYGDYGVSHHSF